MTMMKMHCSRLSDSDCWLRDWKGFITKQDLEKMATVHGFVWTDNKMATVHGFVWTDNELGFPSPPHSNTPTNALIPQFCWMYRGSNYFPCSCVCCFVFVATLDSDLFFNPLLQLSVIVKTDFLKSNLTLFFRIM